MNKICSICGYNCEDTAAFCPICGTPFSDTPATVSNQPVIEPVPVPPQTPVQPQPHPSIQASTQVQPQVLNPSQSPSYIQNPGTAGQMTLGIAEPAKKSTKTLWIVLGIVGGVILLLLILALVLFFLLRSAGYTIGNNGHTWGGAENRPVDYHEYYYPDYDNASFHSEAFTDATTEAPATEAPATEAPTPSGYQNDAETFQQTDLTIYTIEEDPAITPAAFNVSLNHRYSIDFPGIMHLTEGTYIESPEEFAEKQAATGRGITTGQPIEEFITAYGIDTTNAMWITFGHEQLEYFYYSTTAMPELAEGVDASLTFGWYQTGDTWHRMMPEELYGFWKNMTLPECDEVILYNAITNADYTIYSMGIGYGDPAFWQEYITTFHSFYDTSNVSDTE